LRATIFNLIGLGRRNSSFAW